MAWQPTKPALKLPEGAVAGLRVMIRLPLGRFPDVEQQGTSPHGIVRLPRADTLAPTQQPLQPAHGYLPVSFLSHGRIPLQVSSVEGIYPLRYLLITPRLPRRDRRSIDVPQNARH